MSGALQPETRPPTSRAWLSHWTSTWTWVDLLWLIFLGGLALLPPRAEIHKQLLLLAFALFQLSESVLLAAQPRLGAVTAVVVKIALATLLIAHTGGVAINSSYYPIYYLPAITAAMLFGPWGTLGWTTLTSAAYLSYLAPALQHYRLDAAGRNELALRIFFLYFFALIVNRFAVETRAQRDLYRGAAESLEAANRDLRQARAEAQRAERLAALGQLSAGLAHEIRNPLAVIKTSAEMLEKKLGGAGAVAAELAGYISSEVNRVNQLVIRFLDFARPQQLERAAFDLQPLLDRALDEVRARWPEAPVQVVRAYSGVALPPLEGDAALCERAFANLAANAYEAMGEQGGTLLVGAQAAHEHGAAGVLVEFRDTGPGVPGELREQIFNPFFTTKSSGVGLGLAIVSKIADQHGGFLRLGEPSAGGAVFQFFLPARGTQMASAGAGRGGPREARAGDSTGGEAGRPR